MIDGIEASDRFSLVEHPTAPHALVLRRPVEPAAPSGHRSLITAVILET